MSVFLNKIEEKSNIEKMECLSKRVTYNIAYYNTINVLPDNNNNI